MTQRLTFILLIATFVLIGHKSICQTNLSSDISLLFGNLPMNLTIQKIITFAKSNKNFKGHTHYNLDLSYSGQLISTKFFKLKPDTCFIEIVSNAAELFHDSTAKNFSFFTFDASYSKADTVLIKREFDRIVNLFSIDFFSGRIEKGNGSVYFYKSKEESKPTLTLYISKDDECYAGKRCIKLTYFKKKNHL